MIQGLPNKCGEYQTPPAMYLVFTVEHRITTELLRYDPAASEKITTIRAVDPLNLLIETSKGGTLLKLGTTVIFQRDHFLWLLALEWNLFRVVLNKFGRLPKGSIRFLSITSVVKIFFLLPWCRWQNGFASEFPVGAS